MSKKSCPNCNFKNEEGDEFCQECGSSLDLEAYIDSKKIDKSFTDKVKSFFGNKRINKINDEIEDFIRFSQNFNDFYDDLSDLSSFKLDKLKFKEKYSKISKLDDYKYLDEINEDDDLNKKVLFLKSIRTFINNFDDEIKKLNRFLDDIKIHIKDIDAFNNDFENLLNSDLILDVHDRNFLIQTHKFTFDFFDREKVKELNIDSKDKIREFLNKYESINKLFDTHNEEVKIKKHDDLISKYYCKAESFINKIDEFKAKEEFIPSSCIDELKEEFQESYEFLNDEDISNLNLSAQEKSNLSKYLNDYTNLNDIIDKINEELSIKLLQKELNFNIDKLNQFNDEYTKLLNSNFYITFKQKDELIEDYQDLYDLVLDASEKIELSDEFNKFLKDYPLIEKTINLRNEKYVEDELEEHKEFFDNIDGKSLDDKQRLAVVKNELNSQIIAGAGCGKTLTVNAKVRYLIEKKGINPNEILCLSFSNASVSDLKEKLPADVEIATFHKLGGSILRANDKPARPDTDAMDNFVKEYFKNHVINNEKLCEDIFEFYSYYLYS